MVRSIFLTAMICSTVALAAGLSFLQLNPAQRFEIDLCASGGSSSVSVTPGTYLMRITGADTSVCYAATCASGGEPFPAGTIIGITIGAATGGANQAMSCRSSASTGNFILTAAQ